MTGTVYLVGAGPGDPELLTVRAHRLIETADVVLHDALVGDAIVRSIPDAADAIDVGKRPGPDGTRTTQADIHRLMVDHARQGHTVVRLKGGDPGVFGRCGEEVDHLAVHDIPVEVVPGVSSIVGAPGVAGIPLTHREHASTVTVITGQESAEKSESSIDWESTATMIRTGGTLVIVMGVRALPSIVTSLEDHGVPDGTRAATIQKATTEDERVVSATLASIVGDIRAASIEPPAITVVGDVVGVRDRLTGEPADSAPSAGWFRSIGSKPPVETRVTED